MTEQKFKDHALAEIKKWLQSLDFDQVVWINFPFKFKGRDYVKLVYLRPKDKPISEFAEEIYNSISALGAKDGCFDYEF